MNKFVKLVPNKTVASVMAVFTKAIADLGKVEQQQRAEADKHLEAETKARIYQG